MNEPEGQSLFPVIILFVPRIPSFESHGTEVPGPSTSRNFAEFQDFLLAGIKYENILGISLIQAHRKRCAAGRGSAGRVS
jgi:hypothetical protein